MLWPTAINAKWHSYVMIMHTVGISAPYLLHHLHDLLKRGRAYKRFIAGLLVLLAFLVDDSDCEWLCVHPTSGKRADKFKNGEACTH